MLTAIVLTKNEEKNIRECLGTLDWADEIIVVDDNSEDKTIPIIQNLKIKNQNDKSKIKIFTRSLNGDFAAQRNFALRQAQGESFDKTQDKWVLFVDADERISPLLRDEIKSVTEYKYPTVKGFYLKREDKMWGRELRHGETAKVRLLRLGRKDAGNWEGKVHEVWKIEGETGELKNSLLHLPHPTISEFLEEINFYSTLRAKELYNQDKKTNLWEILSFPTVKFFQNYLLKKGFLDGMPGFAVALLMSFHSFLVRAKLYLLWKQGGEWK